MSAAVEPVTDKLVVSPNPATDFITLGIEKSADITIFDIKGREMIHTALPAGARLYTGNLPNGSYLLRARIGGGIQETGLVVVGH